MNIKLVQKFPYTDWEAEFDINIGSKSRKGADGLAFWYTEDRGVSGDVFGSKDLWKGLGIFFDSFDNDYRRNNPSIYAIVNDGTRYFDHDNDGGDAILGQCTMDFRNLNHPFYVRVRYVDGALEVFTDKTGQKNNWQLCFQAAASLPRDYYFGFSAATGEVSDQHSISSFVAYSFDKGEDEFNLDDGELLELDKEEEKEEEIVVNSVPIATQESEKETLKKPEPETNTQDKVLEANEDILRKLESLGRSSVSASNIDDLKDRMSKIDTTLTQYMESFSSFQKLLGEALQTIIKSGNEGPVNSVTLDNITKSLKSLSAQVEKLKTSTSPSDSIIKKEINNLTTQVNAIKSSLTTMRNDLTGMANTMSKMNTESSTFDFWIYIIVFQVVFFLGLIFWKKMRDESKHKLY